MQFNRLFGTILAVLSLSTSLYGQVQKSAKDFPSYEDIKPKNGEIVDYISSDRSRSTTLFTTSDLYKYPKGSVIYILNGKRSTNVKHVKKELSKPGVSIEGMAIRQPDDNGKRIIEIRYELKDISNLPKPNKLK